MQRIRRLDAQGRPVTDVEHEQGVFTRDVDEKAVASLGGDRLTLAATEGRLAEKRYDLKGRSPYGHDALQGSLKKRSGLDYMRKLSDEIKRRRDNEG